MKEYAVLAESTRDELQKEIEASEADGWEVAPESFQVTAIGNDNFEHWRYSVLVWREKE